jgi:hypothetical protein
VVNILRGFPFLFGAANFTVLWLCAALGALFGRRATLGEQVRGDFGVVLTASLTLLGLIIGFTFSMAVSRYDLRKNYEEQEANAIGTEYLRVQLLPAEAATQARARLREYLGQRVLFYTTSDAARLREIDAQTQRLQGQLWSTMRAAVAAQPSAPVALVAAGMNDVFNSQGYTQAAWWNRIPLPAWAFLVLTAVLCNVMLGYATHYLGAHRAYLVILPLLLSIAFFLIADIDSPRGGTIHVVPENLLSVAETMR